MGIVYDNEDDHCDTYTNYRNPNCNHKKNELSNLDNSCIEESCVIDNSISGFDKSINLSSNNINNRNLSPGLVYEAENNVTIEKSGLNIQQSISRSVSLCMNNSNLSTNYSPTRKSDSLNNKSNSNSRISYV